MDQYAISNEFIQIMPVDTTEMKELLEQRFNRSSSSDSSWPLFACNGTSIGTLDELHNWLAENSEQLRISVVDPSSTISCTSLVSQDSYQEEIYESNPLCSSLDVSSICSENHEFLTESQILDLSCLSADSESAETPEEAKQRKLKETQRAITEAFSLNQGFFSSWVDWASSKFSNIVTYWTGDSNTTVLPEELPSFIVPILRQNEFFCWQRRLLFFYEDCFARIDPSSESPRAVKAYNDINTVSALQGGVIIIGYVSGDVDYFYSSRSQTQEILLSRLRPRS